MRIFQKKERNKLNNYSISDVLINYTLNLMGKSKDSVFDYLKNEDFVKEETIDDKISSILYLLENECILSISIEEDKVFKVNIWLNHKASKSDLKNLQLFHLTHQEEYHFYHLKDTSNRLKRYMIAMESKIY